MIHYIYTTHQDYLYYLYHTPGLLITLIPHIWITYNIYTTHQYHFLYLHHTSGLFNTFIPHIRITNYKHTTHLDYLLHLYHKSGLLITFMLQIRIPFCDLLKFIKFHSFPTYLLSLALLSSSLFYITTTHQNNIYNIFYLLYT